jgi:hypothetical protein
MFEFTHCANAIDSRGVSPSKGHPLRRRQDTRERNVKEKRKRKEKGRAIMKVS